MNIKKYIIAAVSNLSSVPWKVFNIIRRKLPFDYRFLNGWSFPPEMVTILITKKCNFSCPGCSSSSPEYTKKFRGQELSTIEIKKFIDKISWFKPGIYFCGGEPTLRPDLFELIEHAKTKGLVTAFTTNGSLMSEEKIRKVFLSGLDFISFSLDGTPKHHNTYRGFPNAYENLVESISRLVKIRKMKNLNSPNIRITCIINPADANDAIFVLKKGEELGVNEVAFGNLMFYPESYRKKQEQFIKKTGVGGLHMIGFEIKGESIPFTLDLNGLKDLYKEIKLNAKLPISFVPSKIDYEKFYSLRDPSESSMCLSPWFVATILPDGELTSCQEYPLGDLKESSFMSLWNSEKMKKFRRQRKKGVFPACFRCIEGQEIKFD